MGIGMTDKIVLKGIVAVKGLAEGQALVTGESIHFLGGVDYKTGVVTMPNHELEGKSVAGKILVFPAQVGSSGEPIGLYFLTRTGKNPKAILCSTQGQMPVVSSIVARLPFVYNLDRDPVKTIETGDHVRVNADKGIVEVIKDKEKRNGN